MIRRDPTARRMPLWIVILVGILAAVNGIGLAGVVADGPLYATLPVPFAPAVRAAFHLVWIALFIGLLIGLLHAHPTAYGWTAPLITLYALASLIWLLVFVQTDYDRGRIPFQIALSIFLMAPIWWIAWRNGYIWRRKRDSVA